MPKTSAGILLYKFMNEGLRVFLVHPGGPFWKDKEEGAWSIPKGEIEEGESAFSRAVQELKEETGVVLEKDQGSCIDLGEIQQRSGKIVKAWACQGDWSGLLICSSYVEVEWPPRSNKKMKVPEVDKAGFFKVDDAKKKINPAQRELIERLEKNLRAS